MIDPKDLQGHFRNLSNLLKLREDFIFFFKISSIHINRKKKKKILKNLDYRILFEFLEISQFYKGGEDYDLSLSPKR